MVDAVCMGDALAKLLVAIGGLAIFAIGVKRGCDGCTHAESADSRPVVQPPSHSSAPVRQAQPPAAAVPRRTTAPIAIDASVAASAADAVRMAIGIFHDKCDAIDRHADDVEWARASFETIPPDSDYRRDRYGWRSQVLIEIKLSESPTTFSGDARPYMGQQLHYHLGGGNSPGITTSKRSEAWLCGMVPAGGSDVFRPVVELSFLK